MTSSVLPEKETHLDLHSCISILLNARHTVPKKQLLICCQMRAAVEWMMDVFLCLRQNRKRLNPSPLLISIRVYISIQNSLCFSEMRRTLRLSIHSKPEIWKSIHASHGSYHDLCQITGWNVICFLVEQDVLKQIFQTLLPNAFLV